jgi:hypothetical protein
LKKNIHSLGYKGYKDELPFDPSMMVYFRKRLLGNILKEINALIIERATEEKKEDDDADPPGRASGVENRRRWSIRCRKWRRRDMRSRGRIGRRRGKRF